MNRSAMSIDVVPVGVVESALVSPVGAPRQADEGAPPAWLAMLPSVAEAIRGLIVGDRVTVVTWLHLAQRDVLITRPRDDHRAPERGVFCTRSPDRPNPIGLHQATITAVDGLRLQVDQLEAVNGTPIVDLKCAL